MSENTVIRAFELPLDSASNDDWRLIRECWKHARMLANWCQTEMLRQDDPDLPKAPEFDLYARAFGREKEKSGLKDKTKVLPPRKAGFKHAAFFEGCMLSAASIINDVQSDYRRDRYDVLMAHTKVPTVYRSYPWPVHGQSVKGVRMDDNGRPWITITLPGGAVEFRMRNGRDFAPQIGMFRKLLEMAKQGKPFTQVVLREKRCQGGDVMVKMVAKVPVREKLGDRCLILSTDPQAFWAADFIKEGVGERNFVRAWILNNDHVRRVVARHCEHLRTLKRMGQDAKAERRMGGGRAWQQQTRLDILCENDRNRLASFTHEAACHLAEFAYRNGVGEVLYLDMNKGYAPSFPWHQLHSKLSDKLKERGIMLYSESQELRTIWKALDLDEVNIGPSDNKEEEDKWQRIANLKAAAVRKLVATVERNGSHPAVSVP